MSGVREPVVHAPAVMHERARPIEAQQLLGRRAAAGRIDHITRFPSGRRTHATRPTGRRRASPFRPARPGTSRECPAAVAHTPVAHRSAVRAIERALVPRAIVNPSNNVPSSFTLLPCDRPSCLFKIASAAWTFGPSWLAAAPRAVEVCKAWRPCTAWPQSCAHAHMHVELAIDDRAGNFRLILRRDVGFAHPLAAAVRALFRQRHVVGLVDAGRPARWTCGP